MAKNLLFSFDDLSSKDKPVKALERYFKRAGLQVVSAVPNPAIKRMSGKTYRELALTFADSQSVVLRITQTGDVFQVLLNKKLVPIKNQDDQQAAVTELVKMMDAGRAAFQKRMAVVKVKLPPTIKTAIPKAKENLAQRKQDLIAAVEAAQQELQRLQTYLASLTGAKVADPA